LAQTDVNTLVRAAAITVLGNLKASGNMDIFKQALNSQSYAIQGAALTAIGQLDAAEALKLAKGFESDNKDALTQALLLTYIKYGGEAQWPYLYETFHNATIRLKYHTLSNFADLTAHIQNPADAQQGITELKDLGIKYKQFLAGPITGMLNKIKDQRIKMNDQASAIAADGAIKQLNAK